MKEIKAKLVRRHPTTSATLNNRNSNRYSSDNRSSSDDTDNTCSSSIVSSNGNLSSIIKNNNTGLNTSKIDVKDTKRNTNSKNNPNVKISGHINKLLNITDTTPRSS